MGKVTTKKLLEKTLLAIFLSLLILKDFVGIAIPSVSFLAVWLCFLLVADTSNSAAFTLAGVICFASTMSITIPVVTYCILTFFRNKVLKINGVVLASVYVVCVEFLRLLSVPGEQFRQYVNSMAVVLLVWIIVMQLYEKKISPQVCIFYYLACFTILSLDIVWATARTLGSLLAIISKNFRIGQIEMIDESMQGVFSVNSNGIALMAMVAISAVVLMLNKKHLTIKIAVPLLIYFSIIGFLTVSRAFLLVYIGFWCVYWVWYTVKSGSNILRPIVFILVGFIAVAVFRESTLIKNVMDRFASEGMETSRVEIASDYLDYMSGKVQASFIGIGLQNVTNKVSLVHVPHNATLELFVCLGLLGVLVYAIFFITLIDMSLRFNRTNVEVRHTFINYFPFVVFVIFIQSLQFLRINYIYAMIALIFACMLLPSLSDQK